MAMQQQLRQSIAALKGWLYRSGLALEPLRVMARADRALLGPKSRVAVVIVNWNTLPYLRVTIDAVRECSPPDTQIVVVDNGSSDGSLAYLRSRPDVRAIALRRNLGHPISMDIGWLLARSEYIVSLDVDAFPIRPGWLEALITPLTDGNAVSGVSTHDGIIHPCCLAMSQARFISKRHTFGVRQGMADTGELISLRENRRFAIERTEMYGPYEIGSVFGDIVYHNFYSARVAEHSLYPTSPPEDEHDVRSRAADAWSNALRRFRAGEQPPSG